MKCLNTLSPAEIKLIIDFEAPSYKELMKVTFMDLVLKNVLQVTEIERQPSKRDPVMTYKYVIAGKNFNTHQPLLHEKPFMVYFQKERDTEILFRNVVSMAYQTAGSGSNYIEQIIKNGNLESNFKQTFIQKIFGGYTVTAKGKELKSLVKSEIKQVEALLEELLVKNPVEAQKLLSVINGNVLLLKNIDHEMLREMDKVLGNEIDRNTNIPGVMVATSCGGWSNFDSHATSFDNSCSGGDSGCWGGDSGGGDSGCGGSGCGGGCGGGD